MVAGVVNAPTIDLANEELLTSHLHAVWLAETGQKLPPSIKDLLDLGQDDDPARPRRAGGGAGAPRPAGPSGGPGARNSAPPRGRIAARGGPMVQRHLAGQRHRWRRLHFAQAFDRWRSLFRATTHQMKEAHAIEMNHAIGERERREAKQRYDEARIQHDLLLESSRTFNSDFYTYRYLASQGFLPGYNFPRLPLMAFMPGAPGEDWPRQLFESARASSGCRSSARSRSSTMRAVPTGSERRFSACAMRRVSPPQRSCRCASARLCPACGYAHFDEDKDCERCVQCHALLDGGRALLTLYRIEQVSTRRATRITSDEEERQRQGYEMMTHHPVCPGRRPGAMPRDPVQRGRRRPARRALRSRGHPVARQPRVAPAQGEVDLWLQHRCHHG